eukprot:1931600-Rhodomonas_salina.2
MPTADQMRLTRSGMPEPRRTAVRMREMSRSRRPQTDGTIWTNMSVWRRSGTEVRNLPTDQLARASRDQWHLERPVQGQKMS